MRNWRIGSTLWLALLAAITGITAGTAVAQTTQTKPNDWQQMKDAARQGAQQGHPQQQPQPQPGQKPAQQRQRQQVPGRVQGGGQINDSGPFKPPAGTKVEETVLAPLQDRAKSQVSPRGVHVATVETDGSRSVVWYDGVEGPKFDEILPQTG